MSIFKKNPYVASINQKGKQVNQAVNKLGTIQAHKVQYIFEKGTIFFGHSVF
jgi:hypothetical protein